MPPQKKKGRCSKKKAEKIDLLMLLPDDVLKLMVQLLTITELAKMSEVSKLLKRIARQAPLFKVASTGLNLINTFYMYQKFEEGESDIDPRLNTAISFKTLDAFSQFTVLLEFHQKCVKNLRIHYVDLLVDGCKKSCFGEPSEFVRDDRAMIEYNLLTIERKAILDNIASVSMAQDDLCYDDETDEAGPYYYASAFLGGVHEPWTGSSYRNWFHSEILRGHLYDNCYDDVPDYEGPIGIGSDEHLRELLVSRMDNICNLMRGRSKELPKAHIFLGRHLFDSLLCFDTNPDSVTGCLVQDYFKKKIPTK